MKLRERVAREICRQEYHWRELGDTVWEVGFSTKERGAYGRRVDRLIAMIHQRDTHRSSRGPKLYAVRDNRGRFEDIRTYQRAHQAQRRRKEKRRCQPS